MHTRDVKTTDLAADLDLAPGPGDGSYSVELCRDWNGFGPVGGYLASIALRAAGLHSGRARPASLQCTFLRRPEFGRVEIGVQPVAATKRATASEVVLSQGGASFAKAVVWTVDSGLLGMAHGNAPMPAAGPPEDYPAIETILPDTVEVRFGDVWKGIEDRPVLYDYENWRRPPEDPRMLGWYRFRPAGAFSDAFIDAARPVILIDILQFGAALASAPGNSGFMVASLDLTVHFHQPAAGSEWLLVEALSPHAADGLVNGRTSIWSADGSLVATGAQQMLCRPLPRL